MSNLLARVLGLLTLCSWLASPAAAQTAADFPNKPIRMVVTFPPGGSTDAVLRMLVPRLNEKLGQTVIVDNRPGAGGNVGLTLVAKAPGDGYTLGVGAAGGLLARGRAAFRCRAAAGRWRRAVRRAADRAFPG